MYDAKKMMHENQLQEKNEKYSTDVFFSSKEIKYTSFRTHTLNTISFDLECELNLNSEIQKIFFNKFEFYLPFIQKHNLERKSSSCVAYFYNYNEYSLNDKVNSFVGLNAIYKEKNNNINDFLYIRSIIEDFYSFPFKCAGNVDNFQGSINVPIYDAMIDGCYLTAENVEEKTTLRPDDGTAQEIDETRIIVSKNLNQFINNKDILFYLDLHHFKRYGKYKVYRHITLSKLEKFSPFSLTAALR